MNYVCIGVILLCAFLWRVMSRRKEELAREIAEIREQAKNYIY